MTLLMLRVSVAVWGCITMLASNGTTATEYKKTPGPHAVDTVLYDWHDDQRDRNVPVKIYYPREGPGPYPVIVFSHGLGGTREGYEYLGQHWASHGYVSVHVQHIGSDDSVWKDQIHRAERMKAAAADPKNALNRPPDIHFTIDRLERLQNEEGPLKGRLDLKKLGVAGHSFGAFTTLAVAGQAFITPTGRSVSVEDWRIKAGIVMSPSAPKRRDHLDEVYNGIRIPLFHMTGTRDDSPVSDTLAADRRIAFDHIKGADQYLLTFKDGEHMVYTGRKRLRGDENNRDARFIDLIRQSTMAFWDATLKSDPIAKHWLNEGGVESLLGSEGTFEKHLKLPPISTTAPAQP